MRPLFGGIQMKSFSCFYLLLCALLLPSLSQAANVEVMLVDRLDGDLNNFCLDIVGGKLNANPADGMQAHTCYSYQGELGVDQAIDPAGIAKGEFKVVGFDVCATMPSLAAGSSVALAACDGSDAQKFDMTASGTITPRSAPDMCLTAGKETTLGNNGQSRHQIKALTLQPCSADLISYQQWSTRESMN